MALLFPFVVVVVAAGEDGGGSSKDICPDREVTATAIAPRRCGRCIAYAQAFRGHEAHVYFTFG
jgi:hypothetical protein